MTVKTITMQNALILFLASLLTASAVADTITLRASVRMSAGQNEIRLGDIAELVGEEARRYAETVIMRVDAPDEPLEISLRTVRNALDDAGVHWGRVNLNGRVVVVRPRGRSIATPPMAMKEIALNSDPAPSRERRRERDAVTADTLVNEANVRGLIASIVARGLRVDPDRLQLSFNERDESLLAASTDESRYEVEPVSGVEGDRIDIVVRQWNDDRIENRETIRVSLRVRQPVVIVKEDVERGALIRESDLDVEHQWLPPRDVARVTRVDDAIGRKAAQRLRTGDVLRTQHLYRETLIRRGARVNVRCLVGGAVITLQAEARADGTDGETIEFRKIGERETFLATVTGANEAVINLTR